MVAPVPAVEIGDHAHPLRVRRPDREAAPARPVHLHEVGAQFLVNLVMVPLREKVEVHRPEDLAERIRVAEPPDMAVMRGRLDFVVEPLGSPAGRIASKKPCSCSRLAGNFFPSFSRTISMARASGPEHPDHQPVDRVVHPQHGERVSVICAQQRLHCSGVHGLRQVEYFHVKRIQGSVGFGAPGQSGGPLLQSETVCSPVAPWTAQK